MGKGDKDKDYKCKTSFTKKEYMQIMKFEDTKTKNGIQKSKNEPFKITCIGFCYFYENGRKGRFY